MLEGAARPGRQDSTPGRARTAGPRADPAPDGTDSQARKDARHVGLALDAGVEPLVVMRRAGHRSFSTTLRYAVRYRELNLEAVPTLVDPQMLLPPAPKASCLSRPSAVSSSGA